MKINLFTAPLKSNHCLIMARKNSENQDYLEDMSKVLSQGYGQTASN